MMLQFDPRKRATANDILADECLPAKTWEDEYAEEEDDFFASTQDDLSELPLAPLSPEVPLLLVPSSPRNAAWEGDVGR